MNELILIMPEIFLAMTLAFVLAGEVSYHGERVRLVSATALMGLAGAFVQTLITYAHGAQQIFNASFTIDGLTFFFRLLFISLAALAVIISGRSKEIAAAKRAEYQVLILAATLGMCFAASASDLLLAFLSLQFINVVGYFLAGFAKRSTLSTEAAIKFLIFGAAAAGLLAYGFACLFATAHVLNIYEIHKALVAAPLSREITTVVFALVFMALSFQIGGFPMYFWAPDVLQGAPTPASGFLSVGFRAAGFAVTLRLLLVLFAQPTVGQGQWEVLGRLDWTQMVAVASGVTMLVGALLAIRQKSAKRMVASLVVTQTGLLLMGLLVLDGVGIAAILYSLVIEVFALTGIFFVLGFVEDEVRSDHLDNLKGMLARAVPECIALILFLVCLIGLPPMPGFIGKFALIGAALRQRWMILALIAIVCMALSTIAVARLAYSLSGEFRSTPLPAVQPSTGRKLFLLLLFAPLLLTGIFAEQVLSWTVNSVGFILW